MDQHIRGEEDSRRFSPQQVAPGIVLIDLGFQAVAGTVGSYLLEGPDGLTLIETGPSSTRTNLEEGIRDAGYDIRDVQRLIPTHIHLDHAGAAGVLMRAYPHLRITLHPGAAPFLVDPERLVKSATRIYGDRMDDLWGEVVGIPADRVDTVEDGGRIDAGGRALLVRYTPGHAGTHISLLDEASGTLFTGDAAGARIAPLSYVVPTVSPPEIDFEMWTQTVAILRDLRPERLAVSHFGVFTDVDAHLEQVVANGLSMLDVVRQGLTTGGSEDEVTAILVDIARARVSSEPDPNVLLARMELAMPSWLATLGLQRVLRKRGELE